MKLFAQITKVDEEKRLVHGVAASEMVDKADEIMDYEKSKPHFKKWSEDVRLDSGGKSLGNLRAMHGKVAAGKLTDIGFDDGNKQVLVCAKVVDDAEWKKVTEGVYTGFSIGGSYGETSIEKMEGRDVKRYTAIPSEVSLVDRPCIPNAKFFEVQKADGSLVKVEFKAPAPEPDDAIVSGTPEQVDEFVKLLKTQGKTMGDAIDIIAKACEKAAPMDAGSKPDKDAGAEGNNGAKAKAKADPDEAVDNSKDKNRGDGDGVAKTANMDAGKPANPDAANTGTECDADDADAVAKKAVAKDEMENVAKARDHFKDDAETLRKSDAEVVTLHKAWVEAAPMRKMVEDAVAAKLEPLQKALDAANTKITKLEAQPAPTSVRLRAVAVEKSADVAAAEEDDALRKISTPIKDDHGEQHEAAGLIKALHARGGVPLTLPTHELKKAKH